MDNKIQIIAEAGPNHNGELSIALQLVDVAVKAGADIVKFQTAKSENLISKHAPKAEYQNKNTEKNESQLEMGKKLDMNYNMHLKIIKYCHQQNIEFLSTPFDLDSIDMLIRLGLDTLKLPSGSITDLPYLRKIGGLNKNIILSTGMSSLQEVVDAFNILVSSGTDSNNIVVLHCNTEYPTPIEDVNLKAMITIRDELGVNVGLSDHTLGIETPIAAVALGATVIEKHFTLDRDQIGPDHAASLEPDELKEMITAIRNIEKAMGDGVKIPSASEMKNIPIARKSIVAKKPIKKGDLFTENNLTVKRPGTGISPMEWDAYIGKSSDREYKMDDLIQ